MEFDSDIKDLKDKKIDFLCTIHFDNECLIESLIAGKNIYYA